MCAAKLSWFTPAGTAHWRTDQYFEGHPFLTKDAAQFLADEGAALVGIDSYNIDDTADLTRPAHSILLGAGIPIVEHMCNLERFAGSWIQILCGAGEGKRHGHVSGARVCDCVEYPLEVTPDGRFVGSIFSAR